MRFSRYFGVLLSSYCFFFCGTRDVATAQTALINCSTGVGSGGDMISRAFYIPKYPGVNLRQVTLSLSSSASGVHTFSLAARSNAYDGPLLGTATAQATLTGDVWANKYVTFSFTNVPSVTPGSTVAFIIGLVSGPPSSYQYFDLTASTGCPVVETESSQPPLSTDRKYGINIIVVGDTQATCAYSISPTSRSHGAGAETGTVSVTAQLNCRWTAASNVSWIAITSGSSGSGNGTVGYSVAANTGTSSRTGTLTIAGNTFTVTQLAPCTYSISPTSRSHGSGAETGTVSVTAGSICTWTASSNASWITIISGSSGYGTGVVGYSVAANTGTSSRTGTLTIAGRTFTVTQAGIACTYSISPTSRAHGSGAETGTVSVTAGTGCSWTAASNTSWMSITSGGSGAGSGTVGYSVAANTGTSSRTGTLTIAGQTFTVTQAGIACTYSISPTSRSHGSGAETGNVSVTTGSICIWAASSNASWITITSGYSGNGNGVVGYTVAANPGTSTRTGTLTIASQTFTITQGFTTCTYSIAPSSSTHGPGSETGTASVTTRLDCSWIATSYSNWITVTSGGSGTGSGTVTYAVSANTSSVPRLGSLVIAGQTFGVIQAGAAVPVIASLNPSQVIAGSGGFTLSVSGLNFDAGSTVRWNGMARTTTYVGVTQLRAAIPASDISVAGSVQVTVTNSGGGTSAPKPLSVTQQNPAPSVFRLSPAYMPAGAPGFTMTVVGSGFVTGSRVRWGGQERATTVESASILTAVIPGSDVGHAGAFAVTVFNPAPGGGESAAMVFGVLPGTVISDLSPSSFVPTGKGFKLSLFGLNFLAAGGLLPVYGDLHMAGNAPTVLWNGQPLATVVVSSTELQADVPASLAGGAGEATISVSGGGSGASNVVPLPKGVTQPAPLLSGLSPGSAVPGSGRLALALEGRNFVEGATVLWNGQERQTEFVNSTRLQAIIPEADIAAVGASRVSVLNPAPGGGESNGEMFNIVETLLYPRLASIPRSGGSAIDDSEFTGIGFTNLGDKQATLTLTAFDRSGALISGSGITNPAQVPINAGQQHALVDWQIFGEALTAQKALGWFKTESVGSGLVGFFLMFNHTITKLDGADVSARTGGSFVAPIIEEQGFTQLHVVNPNVQPAEVLFELYGADGAVRAPAVVRTLAPNAAVVEYVSELFAGVTATASDYVRVVSNREVLLFEYLGRPGRDVKGLNGQDAAGGSTVLYSPQYAVGGDWATELTVVNLEERAGVVSMRLMGDNGAVLAGPVQQAVAARGKLQITDQDLFVDSGGGLRQGYVEVRSDGVKLAGSVVFGDPGGVRYTSALPLVSELETDMVFSQLATDQTYYTGLAILNPNAQAVTARVEVYDGNGVLVAGKDEVVVAGGRVSKLLTEYFGALVGQNRSSGYMRVRTNLGVASYAVFGTWAGTSLSAVPPQRAK